MPCRPSIMVAGTSGTADLMFTFSFSPHNSGRWVSFSASFYSAGLILGNWGSQRLSNLLNNTQGSWEEVILTSRVRGAWASVNMKSSYPSESWGVAETGQGVLHSSLETGLQRDLLLCLLLVSSSGWGLCHKTDPSRQEDPPSWHPSLRWPDREDEPVTVFKTNTLFLVESNICLRTKNFNLKSIQWKVKDPPSFSTHINIMYTLCHMLHMTHLFYINGIIQFYIIGFISIYCGHLHTSVNMALS